MHLYTFLGLEYGIVKHPTRYQINMQIQMSIISIAIRGFLENFECKVGVNE